MTNALDTIRPSPSSLAAPPEVATLLSFEDITNLVEFYEAVGWTPAMEMQMLLDMIQHSPSDAVRLSALRFLQQRRADIIQSSGLRVKATKTQKSADGGQTVFSTEIVTTALNKDSIQSNKRSITHVPKPKKIECKERPPIPADRRDSESGRFIEAGAGNSEQTADAQQRPVDGPSGPSDILRERPDTDGGTSSDATFHRPPTGAVPIISIINYSPETEPEHV